MPVQSSDTASALGHRSGEVRRLRAAAVKRIVTATREAQGLPPTVSDVEVLDRVAALLEGGGSDES
jgi:hypothetical protein